MTSKIHEIAVAIRDCTRLMAACDRRVEELRKFDPYDEIEGGAAIHVHKDNAEKLCGDACLMRSALEAELTMHVPQTPADLLTFALVIAYHLHGFDQEPGSASERTVRLLLGRILEGLPKMADDTAAAALEVYAHDSAYLWPERVKAVEGPLPGPVVPGHPMLRNRSRAA